MDVQRKKGILEVCVLAVLKKGASYGYQIIRELEQCVDISESTLYPILKRLEQNGSLATYREEYNGRLRKYYSLTPEGQGKIDAFLDEWEELRSMYQFVSDQNEMNVQGEMQEQAAAKDELHEESDMRKQEEVPEKNDSGTSASDTAEHIESISNEEGIQL